MVRDARDSLPDEAGIALRPQAPIRSLMIRSYLGSLLQMEPLPAGNLKPGPTGRVDPLLRVASLQVVWSQRGLARTSTADRSTENAPPSIIVDFQAPRPNLSTSRFVRSLSSDSRLLLAWSRLASTLKDGTVSRIFN